MAQDTGKLIAVDNVPSDHMFYRTYSAGQTRNFLPAFNNELKMLKDGLPAGIIVKHYADRLDLMSVLIHGPSETIYEDGLFLFDLQLAGNHPTWPPKLHYISYSTYRLNPNLYPCGKVCLSLLNTWRGARSEMWSRNSTLLQVFVSIQSLVLVKEPYYNEPGTRLNEKQSKLYNAEIFPHIYNSQIQLMNTPPTVFRDEVKEHFQLAMEKWQLKNQLFTIGEEIYCNNFILKDFLGS